MKKYIYTVGSFALALAMSGLPAIAAHAEIGTGGEVSGEAGVNLNLGTQGEGASASTSASVRMNEGERSSEGESRAAGSGDRARGGESEATSNEQAQAGLSGEHSLEIELEDESAPPVFSLSELKQTIEVRKRELDQEAASTTAADRGIVENANPVRLGVHALLASKVLLGGIGPQVSQIAKEMNNSIATTTNAEAEIQARGFWTTLLFGGDSAAADVISQEVARNQQNIDRLTALLNQANVSADIQVTLKAQIAAIQDAQARLQALAQSEQSQWGLFSWRF